MRASSGAAPTPVLLGLGSNRCHGRFGRPEAVLRAAARALGEGGVAEARLSPLISTAPLGPSRRRYANGALMGLWLGSPAELLAMVKGIEHQFGRRRGLRWGARVLDIDVLAFGDQVVDLPGLHVPHPRLPERMFVLGPMRALWPGWRHPRSGLTVRQMAARLEKPRPKGLFDG